MTLEQQHEYYRSRAAATNASHEAEWIKEAEAERAAQREREDREAAEKAAARAAEIEKIDKMTIEEYTKYRQDMNAEK